MTFCSERKPRKLFHLKELESSLTQLKSYFLFRTRSKFRLHLWFFSRFREHRERRQTKCEKVFRPQKVFFSFKNSFTWRFELCKENSFTPMGKVLLWFLRGRKLLASRFHSLLKGRDFVNRGCCKQISLSTSKAFN